MEEVENKSSEAQAPAEVALPETEATQEATQTQEQSQQPDQQDKDWVKRLRRDREDAIRREKELRSQNEMLQKLLERQPQWTAPQPAEEDILSDMEKEEYVPGAKVVKGLKKLEEKFDKKVRDIEAKYAEKANQNILNEVKREYGDFDEVVNSETLELLEETNPRLAASLARTMKDDPYAFAVQSYEYIKSKGLSKVAGTSKRANETEKKIEQNKKTVQTPAAFDKRPMAQAFKITPAMQKELAEEMMHYAQQAGMGY
jgi:hypothetical protein